MPVPGARSALDEILSYNELSSLGGSVFAARVCSERGEIKCQGKVDASGKADRLNKPPDLICVVEGGEKTKNMKQRI